MSELFQGIPYRDRDAILQKYFPTPVRIKTGDIVKIGPGLSYLEAGALRVCASITATRERTAVREIWLATLKAGDFFGEVLAFAPGQRPSAYLRAEENCVVRKFRQLRPGERGSDDALRSMISEYPQIAVNIITMLAERLRRTNRLIPPHPRGRVALLLLEAASTLDPEGSATVLENLGLKEITDATGVDDSSVTRWLNHFERTAVIRRDNNDVITILDRRKLATEIAVRGPAQ